MRTSNKEALERELTHKATHAQDDARIRVNLCKILSLWEKRKI